MSVRAWSDPRGVTTVQRAEDDDEAGVTDMTGVCVCRLRPALRLAFATADRGTAGAGRQTSVGGWTAGDGRTSGRELVGPQVAGRVGNAPEAALHARHALELARVADLLQAAADDRLGEVALAGVERGAAGSRLGLVEEDVAGWKRFQ